MLANDAVLMMDVNMLKYMFDGDIVTNEFSKILLLKVSDYLDIQISNIIDIIR